MEPPVPPPSGPRPFAPSPRRAPGGRARPVWIGCGVLLALLGVAAIVFVVKAKDLLAWTMGELRTQVTAALPAEVTVEERARLQRGFDAAMDKIRRGEVEMPALKALQRQLTNAAEKAPRGELTHDDVLDLLSALERVGGLLEPGAEPGPVAPRSDPPESPAPAPSP
jgi:hypothetical protein